MISREITIATNRMVKTPKIDGMVDMTRLTIQVHGEKALNLPTIDVGTSLTRSSATLDRGGRAQVVLFGHGDKVKVELSGEARELHWRLKELAGHVATLIIQRASLDERQEGGKDGAEG